MAGKKRKKKDDEPEYEPEPQELVRIEDEEDDNDDRELDPVLYLDDQVQGPPVIVALVPPDMDRCQCEWRDQTIETFGPKPTVRCEQEPTVVAFQKRDPDDEAATGTISLCDDHKVMVDHMYPGQCYFRRITTEKKIGDFA